MGPLGIKPPRLRVALIAVLAAMAAMAIASPGVASAAPSVKLTCHPTTVEPGESTICEARVNSGSASTPVDGKVVMVKSAGPVVSSAGFCQVQPDTGSTGFCSLQVSGLVPGKVTMAALYTPTAGGVASSTASFTIVKKATITCDPKPVVGDPSDCRVLIPEIPSSLTSPTGSVEWSLPAPHPLGDIEPECTLQPANGGASCSVTFTPSIAGSVQLVARYKGDGGNPGRTVSEVIAVDAGYTTRTMVECARLNLVGFSRVGCFVVVENQSPGDSFPSGKITVTGTHGGASTDCTLEQLTPKSKQSGCAFRFEPHEVGNQTMTTTFSGARFLSSSDDIQFIVEKLGRITVTEPDCETVTLGSAGFCVITVRDFPSGLAARPEGEVTFTADGPVSFSEGSCEVVPFMEVPRISRCRIRYEPLAVGPLTIEAEYQGSWFLHRVSKGKASVVVQSALNAS